jgi:hypothetical protein
MNSAQPKPSRRPPTFLDMALMPVVMRRAFLMALVVGTLLVAINHGRCILSNHFGLACFSASVLTFFVPYGVSTYSSVLAMRKRHDDR